MKVLPAAVLLSVVMLLGGCDLIGGVFKAGMGVGVFVVIAVIVAIVYAISRFRK